MEITFAKRMDSFQEGIFTVLNKKKNELLAQGRTIYNLSVGTPDFKPAPHVMQALTESASKPGELQVFSGGAPGAAGSHAEFLQQTVWRATGYETDHGRERFPGSHDPYLLGTVRSR